MDVKAKVLKGSSWESKATTPPASPGVSGDEEDRTEAGETAPAEVDAPVKKRPKRRRALLRQPSADDVECFSFPTHPLIIKEFLKEFKSTWLVVATPELGVCLSGALSGDTRVPILALTKNEIHSEQLRLACHNALVEGLVDDSPTTCLPKVTQTSLVDIWADLKKKEKE